MHKKNTCNGNAPKGGQAPKITARLNPKKAQETLPSNLPGVDSATLAERIDAEMRSADGRQRMPPGVISRVEFGGSSPATTTVDTPTHSGHEPSLPPEPVAPNSSQEDRKSSSQGTTMLTRAKALEQAVHKWLYRHKYLKEEVARIRAMIEEANGRLIAIETTQERLGASQERLGASQDRLGVLLKQVAHDLAQAFDDRLMETATATKSLERDLSVLKGDMLFQRRRLARLADDLPLDPRMTEQAATRAGAVACVAPTGVDALYVGFEDHFRGTWLEIKERLRPHVDRVRARRPVMPGKPLLDIGSGRGEWLALLAEAGIEAYGVDSNEYAVAACQQRGLPARHEDALTHLAGLPDGALGVITIFHVIEHLPTEVLLRLLDEARRILVTGGLLMLETPNPESIKVGASTFYTDPTHLRPIPPQVAEFLVGRCGFIDVETVRLNPYPDSAIIREDTEAARRLNELMYGPQDYAILAQRA